MENKENISIIYNATHKQLSDHSVITYQYYNFYVVHNIIGSIIGECKTYVGAPFIQMRTQLQDRHAREIIVCTTIDSIVQPVLHMSTIR